jgi:hypothetical protein
VGLEESKRLAGKIAKEAVTALNPFGEKAESLRRLVETLLKRTR